MQQHLDSKRGEGRRQFDHVYEQGGTGGVGEAVAGLQGACVQMMLPHLPEAVFKQVGGAWSKSLQRRGGWEFNLRPGCSSASCHNITASTAKGIGPGCTIGNSNSTVCPRKQRQQQQQGSHFEKHQETSIVILAKNEADRRPSSVLTAVPNCSAPHCSGALQCVLRPSNLSACRSGPICHAPLDFTFKFRVREGSISLLCNSGAGFDNGLGATVHSRAGLSVLLRRMDNADTVRRGRLGSHSFSAALISSFLHSQWCAQPVSGALPLLAHLQAGRWADLELGRECASSPHNIRAPTTHTPSSGGTHLLRVLVGSLEFLGVA